MHDLPGSILSAKDGCDPQSPRSDLLVTADLGFETLYLDDIRQIRRNVPSCRLEPGGLTVSVIRCGTSHGLSNLLPSTRNRAERIGQAGVFPVGVQHLGGFGITPEELVQRQ